jgi:putative tricarboxylic transport membrane protein
MGAAICLLTFGAVAVALSLRLPLGTLRAPDSGFFPLVLGALLVGLAAVHGAQLWRARRPARAEAAGEGGAPVAGASVAGAPSSAAAPHAGEEPRRASGATGRVLAFLGVVAASTALLGPLGYGTASFLLMLGLLRLLGVRWSASGVLALACAVAAHVVFVRWLRIPLPVGPMGF